MVHLRFSHMQLCTWHGPEHISDLPTPINLQDLLHSHAIISIIHPMCYMENAIWLLFIGYLLIDLHKLYHFVPNPYTITIGISPGIIHAFIILYHVCCKCWMLQMVYCVLWCCTGTRLVADFTSTAITIFTNRINVAAHVYGRSK